MNEMNLLHLGNSDFSSPVIIVIWINPFIKNATLAAMVLLHRQIAPRTIQKLL
jgi:hypothetical protein